MVRSRGYIRSVSDIEEVVLKAGMGGVPVRVRDVARVELGPEIRRGIAELDGEGEVAAGIVVMRHGENAKRVIQRVRERLDAIAPTLPEGVEIVTTYDRSELIDRSIATLKHELILQMLIVSLVILIFLWHIPSSVIPIITIPAAVVLSFIPMHLFGISSNIMSLGGIAVAIGALVDAAVVVVENAHKKLELWEAGGREGDYKEILIGAIQEVGRPSFFSLLVIAIAFLPVFALEAQEGRLFRPLAFTKNFAMAIAAFLAITLDPAIRLLFTRLKPYAFRPKWLAKTANAVLVGKMHPEEKHPISRLLFRLYDPPARFVLRHPVLTIGAAVAVVLLTIPAYKKLGSEFMPPLNEGSILYMPTTLPGISVTQAQELLQRQDRTLKSFPEVERVFGKAGRAETSTDPAPFSMMETVVLLKPERQWRSRKRWYSSWMPDFAKRVVRPLWPETMSWDELVNEMNAALQLPGQTNAWTMPIKNRIDMLTTGVRTPVGIKVFGSDLAEIERIGTRLEQILRQVPGTRSVYGERVAGGFFLDFDIQRREAARYGLTVREIQDVIMSGVGGENVTTTIEGRARYPVNVRYPRELRDDPDKLGRVLVPVMGGAAVPLRQLARIQLREGPAMLRDENGRLAGYVYVDVDTEKRDLGSYIEDAKSAVAANLELPTGMTLIWSGQYEAMERVRDRMKLVLPVTLFLIFALLYINTRSLARTAIVLLAVPFSAVGAVWLLYLLGYHMSIGVWVGLIALLGLDAETGVFMLLYLDLSYAEAKAQGRLGDREDLKEAILHGAVKRVRPKVMTVACAFFGLVPIMWSTGTGADVMKRIAAPMIGGLATSFLMELLVYPSVYFLWKWHWELKPALPRGPISV
jgi:Cu(I)/Ag(I) efflux system membrane protein CusA/SilA